MSCLLALMLINASFTSILAYMPIEECEFHKQRINSDYQYEIVFAYCGIIVEEVSG